jgi:hypothetical protein
MKNQKFVVVSGNHYGPFTCGLEFNFNPLTCTRAAPKVTKLFLHKTIEACERIAKENGISFTVLPDAKNGRPHPGAPK